MKTATRDTIFGLVMLGASGLLWLETTRPQYDGIPALNYGFPPDFYPKILLGIWAFVSVLIIVRSRMIAQAEAEGLHPGKLVVSMAVVGLYCWLVGVIGFLLATIPFTGLFMAVLGYRRPVVMLAVTALFPVGVWWLMSGPLQIFLPESPWFNSF
ncbi:tripartite tricarboxylate transporter TctB family protein [Oceanibium sediminis]|uniref:tripartite tricarboxylate transporter TctB family protein n=1 Tax=Oceanibium sediminis TaxID=2026339 RepID=UPI00130046B4|nr:tripartite tricarboxylate transporter TctB family protein [Oceanibium sediminis]